MSPGNNESEPHVSRRRWLEAIGVTGAVTLAGCSGGDEQGTTSQDEENDGSDTSQDGSDTSDTSQDDEERVLHDMNSGELFSDLQWNSFGDQHSSTQQQLIDNATALTRWVDAEITLLGLSDWNYDSGNRSLTVQLRDDITFWNGDQYTAEDFRTFQELLRLQSPESSSYESVEVTGDYEVEFITKEAMNSEIVGGSLVTDNFFELGESVWGEWLERYQDASNQDARDAITEELVNDFEITTERLVEEGLGTGPYIIDDITDQYMDVVAYEDHPLHAGNFDQWTPNIDRIRIWYAEETGRQDQLVVNERVDFATNWEKFKGQLPDYWEQVMAEPRTSSYKMLINWRNREYLQDVNFRRAIAAALNFETIATNTGNLPVTSHTGISEGHNKQYWGDEHPGEMIDYGASSDLDLADEYLERDGYTREDGGIYDSDGNQLDPMRFVIGGGNWGEVAEVAAQQLQQYGFPVDIRRAGRSTKLDVIQENMGEWDLSTETHYASITMHPYEYFKPGTFWGWRLGPGGFGPEAGTMSQIEDWLANGETHSPFNGKPMVFDVPTEVGAEDLSGETKEINVYELVNEIQGPVDEDRDREIIRDLSWAWNYTLPDIDCTFAFADTFGNTKKFEFASSEDIGSYASHYFAQLGLIRSK